MTFVMKVPKGGRPKRGDIIQSNVGDKRERTWLILRVHRINIVVRKPEDFHEWEDHPRFAVWRARWWELEPDFRVRLYRSAERNGGQVVWKPESRNFENLRRRRGRLISR